ncbi:nose resistant to fluoxetine protein 6-like [Drosophila albomicans]|uniref:Nose resistant to fluoxetine protein 6-like n=1 Tax=Drosophila albomicans TaxID=7291 RepID=A0A9C6T4E8_DROAB|nr:nose resistant to fluoxetine protein 6-like [Drosophila albomicans]
MDAVKLIIVGLFFYLGLTEVSSMQDAQDMLITKQQYQRIMEYRPLAVEFTEHFRNFSLTDLELANNETSSEQDQQCQEDVAQLMQGVITLRLWALEMIDSWGSYPSGFFYGNSMDMGNYDECLSIDKEVAENHIIRGKYCLASLLNMKIAVCFPSSCSVALINTFLKQLTNNALLSPQISNEINCKTAEREPYDGLTIFTIVLLSVLAAAVLLATLCDYLFFVDQTKLPGIVKAFSARANSRVLFRLVQPNSNPNVIDCLHGMRCMSLIWVVFAHQYILSLMTPNVNGIKTISWLTSPFASFILHGFFSVDTFFLLSGLLVVMIALRSLEKTKGKLNIPLMYLHRYLRLTPVVAVAIIVHMKLLPIVGNDGPTTAQAAVENYENCKTNWWMTLLYVQNYATKNMCLNHTWYLAVDMQLYILSPIFLLTLYKWGKKAAAGIFVLMLLLSGCLFATMMTGKYAVNVAIGDLGVEGQRKLYLATHTHAAPWLIGALLGYFLHANRNRSFKLHRIFIWLGWILCLAMLFTSLFAVYPAANGSAPALTLGEQSAYYTLSRIAWPLGLSWVVFACMKGYGGLANSFLSSPLWQPLSKLSYTAYIFHIFIQQMNGRRLRTNTFFSDYDVMLSFWSAFGFILLLSYVMYIILEAPFGALEGMLMPQRKPKQNTKQQNENHTEEIHVIEVPRTDDSQELTKSCEEQENVDNSTKT